MPVDTGAPLPSAAQQQITPPCRLLVLASLPAIQREDGHWLLPAKLVTGMCSYASQWPAPVILGLPAGS